MACPGRTRMLQTGQGKTLTTLEEIEKKGDQAESQPSRLKSGQNPTQEAGTILAESELRQKRARKPGEVTIRPK